MSFSLTQPTIQNSFLLITTFFGQIKNALRGRQFADDKKFKDAVHTLLHAQLQIFFAMTSRSSWSEVTNVWGIQGFFFEK
jgi:hypothetical protein